MTKIENEVIKTLLNPAEWDAIAYEQWFQSDADWIVRWGADHCRRPIEKEALRKVIAWIASNPPEVAVGRKEREDSEKKLSKVFATARKKKALKDAAILAAYDSFTAAGRPIAISPDWVPSGRLSGNNPIINGKEIKISRDDIVAYMSDYDRHPTHEFCSEISRKEKELK